MTWTPLGADLHQHHTLVDGTPDWMLSSLRERFRAEFGKYHQTDYGTSGYWEKRVDRMREFDLASRGRPFADILESKGFDATFSAMTADERIRVLDWIVKDNASRNEQGSSRIEQILRDGGSKWTVGVRNGEAGLEERVPQGVIDAAEAAMSLPGDAGRLLSEAWRAVYGVDPQPDTGYRKSIEAVEAIVLPLVLPNDSTAHLGKAISQMRADADWKLPFVKEHVKNPSREVVLGMLQALWSGHTDRHPGTSTYVQSSPLAAEASVSLAVALVNLFTSGAVARR